LPIQARLFEAFQSDKAEAGNGLGLWICKTIVDKHGGRVRWRSSTEGKTRGTAFSVLLPLDGPKEIEGFGKQSFVVR
jgi:signal transduction histidine kinase